MSGNELREAYLQFFSEKKGHLRLPSFSLIPQDDPTLLLIGSRHGSAGNLSSRAK